MNIQNWIGLALQIILMLGTIGSSEINNGIKVLSVIIVSGIVTLLLWR